MSQLLVAQRALTVPGWAKDALWRSARAVPSLDLRFADNKSLADAVTGASLITFTRASDGTFVDSAGVLQTAAIDVPRFDHNPTTGESLGLLVEEPRTNLLLWSEDFSNVAWVANSATVTTNTQTAPNGTLTADTFSPTSGTSSLHQIITCLASTAYTWSFYVKLGTMAAADFRFAVRDDSNGAFIATDIVPNVTPVTTEWRRVTYTFTTPVGCVLVRPYLYRIIPATYGTTVHLWGADLQAGAFPTSYIPTTTAAVTRSADVASITGTAFSGWYRQDEGSFFCSTFAPKGTIIYGTGDTFDNTQYISTGLSSNVTIRSGGADSAQLTAPVSTTGTTNVAHGYAANNFAAVSNGGTVSADTSGVVPLAQVRLKLGSSAWDTSGGNNINGHIRRLTYWPQRLPNPTLQSITQ